MEARTRRPHRRLRRCLHEPRRRACELRRSVTRLRRRPPGEAVRSGTRVRPAALLEISRAAGAPSAHAHSSRARAAPERQPESAPDHAASDRPARSGIARASRACQVPARLRDGKLVDVHGELQAESDAERAPRVVRIASSRKKGFPRERSAREGNDRADRIGGGANEDARRSAGSGRTRPRGTVRFSAAARARWAPEPVVALRAAEKKRAESGLVGDPEQRVVSSNVDRRPSAGQSRRERRSSWRACRRLETTSNVRDWMLSRFSSRMACWASGSSVTPTRLARNG